MAVRVWVDGRWTRRGWTPCCQPNSPLLGITLALDSIWLEEGHDAGLVRALLLVGSVGARRSGLEEELEAWG